MRKTFRAPVEWTDQPIEVVLVGCGGTGSSMLDELFRMHSLLTRLDHPGLSVTAWDGDKVSEANVGRQRFWPCDIGWNKAEILVTRYNSFGETEWDYIDKAFDVDACERMRADLLITCVDSPEVRAMIGEAGPKAWAKDALWMDTGNDHDSGQVILGHLGGRELRVNGIDVVLPNVADLYPTLKEQKGQMEASCSTEEAISKQDFGINQRVAIEASGMLWQLIRYGQIDRHGSFIYQKSGEVFPLHIDEEQWQSFAA